MHVVNGFILSIVIAVAGLLMFPSALSAAETDAAVAQEPLFSLAADTVPKIKKKRNTVFRRIGRAFTSVFREFNHIDTSYIERQHYNYAAMLQNTNTYEIYELKSKSGQSIKFAPKPTFRIGPYFGWRWIFLGYTFDVSHLNDGNNKKEYDISLYSSLFGIDLYYRKTGDDYKIRSAELGDDINSDLLNGTAFSGLDISIKGFDLYYIFNHRKFSYPAAFSQSTCQRRSCGSALAGIGYTRHEINLDYEELESVVNNKLSGVLGEAAQNVTLDSDLTFSKVRYSSYTLSGGYAYNWVFARNCLLAASASLGLSYKVSSGDIINESTQILSRDFSFKNFNFDGIGRFGFVWNNSKWFFGANTILHSYSYDKSRFSMNNVFGSVNIYIGFNFGRK